MSWLGIESGKRGKKLRNMPSTASSDNPGLYHHQTHSFHRYSLCFLVLFIYLFIYFLKFGIKFDLRLGILTWLDCIKLFGLDLVLNKEFGLRMVLISVICVRFGFPLGYLGSIFFLVYLYTLKLSFYLFHFKFFVETFFPFITSFPMFLF